MSLVRTSRNAAPLEEVAQMTNRLRRLFESPFDLELFPQPVGWMPAVDVTETPDELLVTAELPGMTRDNVEIFVEANQLTLRGEKKEERAEDDKERKVHVWERSYGAFTRSFILPREIESEKIRADFADGVLKLHLPKTEKARGRKIEISTM
ncbi:MAG TPA: Hsp20/alpha crystallin family protein [Longimicrobium sp.]|nr:Hsp20/alpha crystallin family protein [Longimicrobium sp.]